MLTATYSIVAFSAEQKKVCSALQRLRQYVDEALQKQSEPDLARIQSAFDLLSQFEQHCHSRKLEKVLIPAVRSSCREADGLVAELESMSDRALALLRSAQEQLRFAFDSGMVKLNELFDVMASYCDSLLKRFAREEEELLPLAMRSLTIDQWFDIAAELLSDDSQPPRKQKKPASTQAVPS
jgi:hemerythrin-like domain-containing protein